MSNLNSPNKKIKFTESEQELYDAILDEYNDIFENIFNIKEKNIFDKILINAKAILGEKKMEAYSKQIISKVLSSLKILNYIPDITALKPLKKYILSLKKNNKIKKIQCLEVDDIFAHCKDCSKCYHICGEILLKPSKYDFILCIKCNMVYKKNLIHLYCQECNEEYYSYIVDDSEPDYENYYPATWEKYHCPNFICEEMTCPECEAMLYYNEENHLLKCFECNWKCNSNNKKWICEICDSEFTSPVKEYVRFETKPMVNCVRDALVQKILAHPPPGKCCYEDPSQYIFRHINKDKENNCNGILYFGYLQKKEVVICSECRLVQHLKEVNWECPNCLKIFNCKKKKQKKSKYKSNINVTKVKNLLKEDKATIFQPKKLAGFHKIEKNQEYFNNFEKERNISNDKDSNNYKRGRKMEKSMTSGVLEPLGRIICKKINPLKYVSSEKYNIAKVKNKKNNSDENENSDSNENDGNISDSENSLNDIKSNNNSTNKQSKIFSFYKKPQNNLYNNITKVKKNENSENVSFNNEYSEKFYQTAKNINYPKFYMIKKEALENHNRNLSLKDMKLLSLRNQKYISKSKIKFAKSSNENSLISNKNLYTDNNLYNSGSKNKNNYNQIKTKLIHSGKKINLNLNLNININNYVDRSHSIKNHTIENNLRGDSLNKNNLNIKNLSGSNNSLDMEEPNENFNPEDFKTIKQIGEGSFGKIYCSEWKKNNKYYAMKKMILHNKNEIKKNKDQTDLVYNFLKKTNNNGVIKIYGSQYNKISNNEYNFHVLMELAEIDWEKEIKKRKQIKNYYTEGELYEITRQLIKTFALLQKNNITHRDIKPQNILIVDNNYKICDFGEAKVTEGNSVIRQTIKGTELYMSPILFRALNKRQTYIIHNTFKSDVFSLGMCLFLAATLTFQSLYDIRELKDMNLIKNILEKYLIVKYSYNFVNILIKMLEINENLRPDFIELDTDLYQK